MNHPQKSRHFCLILFLLVLMTGIMKMPDSARADDSLAALLESHSANRPHGGTPTDMWAMLLPPDVDPEALAGRYGLEYRGRVGTLPGVFLFRVSPARAGVFDAAALRSASEVLWVEQQRQHPRVKRLPTDPLFADQWHLHNVGQAGGEEGVDVNVAPVWSQGIFGASAQIAVVDDGLEHEHPDLRENYVAASSWDFNGDQPDPRPGSYLDDHGTAVAGVAAARDDGLACGVGVAYRARLAGLRLIAGWPTDAMEAGALTHDYQMNHIFTNSWGPTDDGTLDGPGPLTRLALEDGVRNGRNGLGAIYVWAGGNGRRNQDNVNYDGYANSRHTIAVGAVDHSGRQAYYSEPGAALHLVAPSSGSFVGVTTTDILLNSQTGPNNACRDDFGGTSSATPVVAGVIALMLDVNPQLTWRDAQHVLIDSARRIDPEDVDWIRNGSGRWVNHKYGFGLVDAARAVELAQTWEETPDVRIFDSETRVVSKPIQGETHGSLEVGLFVPETMNLEHVELVLDASHPRRGDLEIVLTSPKGTVSVLAEQRRSDWKQDYTSWKFMSLRHWGESSRGTWKLRVTDRGWLQTGVLRSWRLILHGTEAPMRNQFLPGVLMLILGEHAG